MAGRVSVWASVAGATVAVVASVAGWLAARKRVELLEAQVAALKSSVAGGLAEGYFLNFARYVARDVAKLSGGAPRFYVVVPQGPAHRWELETPITEGLREAVAAGRAAPHALSDPASGTARPRHVHRLVTAASDDVLFDVPTTLQVLHANARDAGNDAATLDAELDRFVARLEHRVDADPDAKPVVRIVRVPADDPVAGLAAALARG